MADCFEIKQGMIFFVEDITSEESTVFKGEHTPKKRRPWVIVSNNRCNTYGHILTGVPVYTRSEITLPTQVYFEYHGRHQVIACENVTAIPRELIDMRGYVGTLSNKLLKKVQNALATQFSSSYGADDVTNTISNSVENIIKNMDINSIVMEQLCSILLKRNVVNTATTINLNGNKSINTTPSTPITVNNDENIENTNNNNNVTNSTELEVKTEPEVKTASRTVTRTSTNTNTKTPRKIKHKKHGIAMTLEDAINFYTDCDTLSTHEIYEKWKVHGVLDNKKFISKKKYSVKKRLEKEGLL